jgi:predicted outer membrane repeat protein
MNLITKWLHGIVPTLVAGLAHADATVTACGQDVWPGDARTDLSEALQAGGRITFACAGTIAFTTTHALGRDVVIDGEGKVTLDGNGHRMFGIRAGVHASFTRITIRGGGTSGGNPGSVISGEGAVSLLAGTTIRNSIRPIWLLAGNLVLRDAWIAENTGPVLVVSEGELDISQNSRLTDNKGGEVLATGPGTTVRIADTQFLRNGHASFGGSAAGNCEVTIRNAWFADNADTQDGGAILSRCALTVEDSQFERNRAGGDGGAIRQTHGATAVMRKVTFRANQAAGSGGAIAAVWDLQRQGSLRVRNSRFERNVATRAGGAIYAGESALVEISVDGFVGNTAGTAGGAIYARQARLDSRGSLFRQNTANTGAAIQTLCMPAMGQIANTILVDNSAKQGAGAFHGGNVRFLNVTIAGNGSRPVQHAQLCGDTSAIEFANTIVLGNWNGACGGADAQRTFRDLGHNLQFPGNACGSTIPSVFPILGPFYAPLRPLSPAGNGGDNALCMAAPINGRDIFGTHRPQGEACSIGAVEGDLSTLFDRYWRKRHDALTK